MTRTPAKPVKLILKDGQDAHGEAADLYWPMRQVKIWIVKIWIVKMGMVEDYWGEGASKFFARQAKFVGSRHSFIGQ